MVVKLSMAGLPSEVIDHILEFNPCHRDFYRRVLRELQCIVNRKIFEKATCDWMSTRQSLPYDVFLRQNLKDDYERIFQHLAQCVCCFRHSFDRPSCISALSDELVEPISSGVNEVSLWDDNLGSLNSQCTCRKSCQWICKAFAASRHTV